MEKPDKYFAVPNWQKDAVASELGWHHPKTGEILIKRKGLMEYHKKEVLTEDYISPVEEVLVDDTNLVESVIEDIQEEIKPETLEKPVKKSKKQK